MHFAASPVPDIPGETFLSAHRVFDDQNIYLRIGDQLEDILAHIDLTQLDPTGCLNGDTVLRLSLTNAFQYAESLSDLAASEATLRRLDWKYALHLPLIHPGLTAAALCEFRQGLYDYPAGLSQFAILLQHLHTLGLFAGIEKPSSNMVEVLSAVCLTNRLFCLNQVIKTALSTLIAINADWVRANMPAYWYERYMTGKSNLLIGSGLITPQQEADLLGADISRLLAAVRRQKSSTFTNPTEVRILCRLFDEQYTQGDSGVRWRPSGCANCTCNPIGSLGH